MQQNRIPEQQGVGQTLPPVPVGIDTMNSPPLPPGAMPAGTRLQVGKYQVIVHNFIAEGGFAHVYIARIEGKSGYVVLKRVAVPDGERLKMVEKEIAFMRRLGDHKNIVRYYESRIDALPIGGFEALILMEYCPGGGVIDLMNRRLQQRLTEPEILKIFSDVAEALAYMHYCNPPVLHRDLKVENILILNQDHYKLCDFGSASLSKGNYIPTTLRDVQKLEDDIQRHTTLQYRAPEMVDVYQKKPVNEKADIWAMGVLLYKLCYYTTPFEEEGQLAILNARYTIPTSPLFSDGLRRLIMSMLQEDQHRRPNIYQVLQAVCQLRGMECPIRDIYSEPIATPASFSSPSDNPSIFEKIPMPAQEVPTITPMRRGRPTKPEKNEAPYDPFDPSHVSKHHPSSPPPLPTHESPTFQNSFQPGSPPTRVQSAPLTHHTTPKPQMATKILQTQPMASEKPDEPVHDDEEKKKMEVKDETMPRINRNVSSSIEARFNAIKNASRNTPIHPVKPIPTVSTSTGKKNKPAPPPKPARFRTHQRTVSSSTATEEPLSASSVDEFEHKFPSLEDLDKTIS
ncbi:Serine/threonine-protein kinase ppk30 [Choanephora cucurbitarum]|uniref:non-specific serine/threonine protein kinase n=1 Tax=Choanephora cucurbitarum TaxID=101091 RepID=A0A1C7N137_9FUNG|nr:Serine/threonine-protein kinase ppk30 [Choanephora cucurbitarum]